jgi:predicted aspartyl protease
MREGSRILRLPRALPWVGAGLLALLSLPALAEPAGDGQQVPAGTPAAPADDAFAQVPGGPPLIALDEVVVSAPEPRYVAPTTRDRIGRIWAPVLINGEGPYRLVLDTGASRSAVTRRVAEDLKLPIYVDAVRLRGVTGSAIASAIKAETLEVGDLLIEDSTLPIVADAFGGAEGVLGAEGLKDKRLVIEFRNDRISIARSHREPPPPGFTVVPFTARLYRGMRVKAMVGTVPVTAIVDTGAQVSVGNLALREALARRRGQEDRFEDAIIGVTQDIQQAARVRIPTIVAGSLLVRNVNVMFSDLYIFDHWKLQSTPALLIGMDVIGVLDTLIIDYRRNELHIRTTR